MSMNINYYIGTIIFLILIFLMYRIVNMLYSFLMEYLHVNKNKSYLEIFLFFCDKAYDSIYKDQLLSYVSSGYKPTEDDLDTTKRNFIKLVVQLLGPIQTKYFISYFGNQESFYMNIILWFTAKLDQDEIIQWVNNKEGEEMKNDNILKSFEN